MPWHPQQPLDGARAGAEQFLAVVAAHADLFDPTQPLAVARAPGRLDLMGGIADYSGSLVLELPLGLAAFAAAQASPEPSIRVRSIQADIIHAQPEVTVPLAALAPRGQVIDYPAARALLGADPHSHWAAYLIGTLIVLAHERGLLLDRGVRLLLDSRVPPGKGVSSSASIEVSAMQAVCAIFDMRLSGRELAILCQKVENLVVGAPCGVMDQMTSACGDQDALLALRCQPAELEPSVLLPADLEVWGIDSGIRHAVSGADYGSVRVGAFMGYRIVAELAGLAAQPLGDGRVSIEDPHFGGYLANIGPSRWLQHFRDRVPEQLRGDAFLERYGGTTDSVTRVDPARTYAVRMPAEHPIHEHHRVEAFRALLGGILRAGHPAFDPHCALLGELMYQSHASYSACGLGSDGTDRLVELVRAAGPESGLYGAKITGGGSGGTVAVLARRGAATEIAAIAERYTAESGRESTIISGSSPGAAAFGVIWMRPG